MEHEVSKILRQIGTRLPLLCRIPMCTQKAKDYNKTQSLLRSSFSSRLLLTAYKTSEQNVQALQFAQRSRNFFSVIQQRIREPGDNSRFLSCHQPASLQTRPFRQSSAGTCSPQFVLHQRSHLLQSPTSAVNYSCLFGKHSHLGYSRKCCQVSYSPRSK